VHHWLGNLGLMLMSLIERAPNDKQARRELIQTFVLPALVAAPGASRAQTNGQA
jgi:hypothetical protein